MFNFDVYLLSGLLFLVMGTPLYLGWRFVRAMERRNSASKELGRLNDEMQSLREQAVLLSQEMSELAAPHSAGRLLERVAEGNSEMIK